MTNRDDSEMPANVRLITFDAYPKFRRVPKLVLVKQKEAYLPEIRNNSLTIKPPGRRKKKDLFGDMAKLCLRDDEETPSIKEVKPSHTVTSSAPKLDKQIGGSAQISEGRMGTVVAANNGSFLMKKNSRLLGERTTSSKLSLNFFPENLEKVVHSYREKFKSKDWFYLDNTNSNSFASDKYYRGVGGSRGVAPANGADLDIPTLTLSSGISSAVGRDEINDNVSYHKSRAVEQGADYDTDQGQSKSRTNISTVSTSTSQCKDMVIPLPIPPIASKANNNTKVSTPKYPSKQYKQHPIL